MSANTTQSAGGLSLPTLLTVLFVGLKLTDKIDWAWGWVLAPIWIGVVLAILVTLVAVIVGAYNE